MTSGKMNVAFFEQPERIVLKEVQIPECENDGMLVRVEVCGICGSDIRNYHSGLKGDIKQQVLGHEIAGVVVEAGNEVSKFKLDDRVAITPDVSCGHCYYCTKGWVNLCTDHKMLGTHYPGGFAQYIYLPAIVLRRGILNHIPNELTFEHAALSEPLSSVIACHENNNIGFGDTVVIIGDGPIGCMHIEAARAKGVSKVLLVGLTKLDFAKRFDPDYIIDAGTQKPVEEVMKITEGLGADIVIIANPVADTQQQGLEMLRKRGKMILFGGVSKTNPITHLNSNLIHYNEISVIGSFSYTSSIHYRALEFIKDKKLSSEKYIDKFVGLDEVGLGIEYAEQGEALKVIVKPWL